jgi:predicted GH43/DUF377 family glycosyl hydrolase
MIERSRSSSRRALLLLLAASSAAACGSDRGPGSPSPTGIDPGKLTPASYRGGVAPQLDLGGPDPGWTWNDPHVLKTGPGAYVMYASATVGFDYPVRLYRLTSSDGVSWVRSPPAPILADAAAGRWDAGGLETPAVVLFKGKYHLFYTAYRYEVGTPEYAANSPGDFRIGHAISDDGITFTRAAVNPIVAPSGTDADPSDDWNAFFVGEPGPVVLGDQLHLYFTAVGADAALGTSLQVIGLVRSSDGETWTPPQLALRPDQTLYPRDLDWVGYSTPSAIALDGEVHLFFDVARQPPAGPWLQLRLHHARSADGVSGWTHDETHIRKAGDFSWAVDEIRSPHALLDGTTLRLYFAGHELDGVEPEHFAVGMMTCDLGR